MDNSGENALLQDLTLYFLNRHKPYKWVNFSVGDNKRWAYG